MPEQTTTYGEPLSDQDYGRLTNCLAMCHDPGNCPKCNGATQRQHGALPDGSEVSKIECHKCGVQLYLADAPVPLSQKGAE